MKIYKQIRLDIKGFHKDLLSAILFDRGALGIEEYSDSLWFIFMPPEFNLTNLGELSDFLKKVNQNFDLNQIIMTKLEERDWNAEWKNYFIPLKIGNNVWVAPPWETVKVKPEEILIIIDPQMAFGTGTHETTQLMIEAMEQYLNPGDVVLDVGTGSGILAILAARMNCSKILGLDIDPIAIENAQHNAQLNGITNINFFVDDGLHIPEMEFDVILANINRQVLLTLLPIFLTRLRTGRKIILSGILKKEKNLIKKKFTKELFIQRELNKNEWVALIGEPKEPLR